MREGRIPEEVVPLEFAGVDDLGAAVDAFGLVAGGGVGVIGGVVEAEFVEVAGQALVIEAVVVAAGVEGEGDDARGVGGIIGGPNEGVNVAGLG